jgi:hypothetical protein
VAAAPAALEAVRLAAVAPAPARLAVVRLAALAAVPARFAVVRVPVLRRVLVVAPSAVAVAAVARRAVVRLRGVVDLVRAGFAASAGALMVGVSDKDGPPNSLAVQACHATILWVQTRACVMRNVAQRPCTTSSDIYRFVVLLQQ